MVNHEKPGMYPEIPKSIPITEIARSITTRMRINSGLLKDHSQYCDELDEFSTDQVLNALYQRVTIEKNPETLGNVREAFSTVLDDLLTPINTEPLRGTRLLKMTLKNIDQRRESILLMQASRTENY